MTRFTTPTWRLALDPGDQAVKGVLVFQPWAEIDPTEPLQERWYFILFGHGRARQQHGDDASFGVIDPVGEGIAQLFVVPSADPRWAEENGHGAGGVQSIF